MAISKELKLAIIQAFYANGKSRIATKRFLVYHMEWGKEAKNIDYPVTTEQLKKNITRECRRIRDCSSSYQQFQL